MTSRTAAVLSVLALLAAPPVAAQQASSYTSDEAKLYEAAKAEGTVVWYVGGPLDGMNAIAAEFQKVYPGIKVETLRLVGVAQYQRFLDETNAKKYLVDVLQSTDYPSMVSLVDLGHIAQWKLPTFDKIPERYRIKDYAYAQYTSTNAIVYNVNKVTPEEVKLLESGWEAVLDPRFKGRFSVSSMKCGVCYAPVHMFMDPKFKDRFGPEFLRKVVAQQPAVYAEVLVTLDRVVAGEQDFTMWGWESAAAIKQMEGAPIRWIFPKPTPDFGNSWQGISKYSTHPNAARLFLNWTMSEKGALAMERIYGGYSTLQGIPDVRVYAQEKWYAQPKEIYPVDWERWGNNYHKDMDEWAAIIKRGRN